MTSDALFGPDGTHAPDPVPVLPDPLVGSIDPATPARVRLPPAPDPNGLRAAVRSAMTDEQPPPRQRPRPRPAVQRPAPRAVPQQAPSPADSLRTPPSGIALPTQPQASEPARALPGRPAAQPHRGQAQRRGGGGWIGCIVVLIFFAVVVFNIIRSIVEAVSGG